MDAEISPLLVRNEQQSFGEKPKTIFYTDTFSLLI